MATWAETKERIAAELVRLRATHTGEATVIADLIEDAIFDPSASLTLVPAICDELIATAEAVRRVATPDEPSDPVRRIQRERDWTDAELLEQVLIYVQNQQDDVCFLEFLEAAE